MRDGLNIYEPDSDIPEVSKLVFRSRMVKRLIERNVLITRTEAEKVLYDR